MDQMHLAYDYPVLSSPVMSGMTAGKRAAVEELFALLVFGLRASPVRRPA